MNATYVQEGKNLDYTNETEDIITAGTVIVLGTIVGVAATNIEPGEIGTIATTGVWEVAKDSNAITAGAIVYYNDESDVATATTDEAKLGIAIAEAAAEDGTVLVRLNG